MTEEITDNILNGVLEFYHCHVDACQISRLGNGHINDTFLIKSPAQTFVLQRINANVFPNPMAVINNAELINQHLANARQQGRYPLSSMRQRANINNELATLYQGQYWRAVDYVDNCFTLESVSNLEQAKQVASSFAQFSAAMSNFPAEKLAEIIPNFHNIGFRMLQLNEAIKQDKAKRLALCESWVSFCHNQQRFIDEVTRITLKLPLNVTHNDTKINNLLFDKSTEQPIAVIDLDTCMSGYLMHDFGDMVRTCCSTLTEDATNVGEMALKKEVFTALAQGYIGSFGETISTLERESLIIGAKLLPFMIGVRFLTDYLDGDNYFSIKHPHHNLERAINQFTLYQLLCQNHDFITETITNLNSDH